MIKALNLGCGRAIFPTMHDNPLTAHLHYALEMFCPEAFDAAVNWVNVDRVKTADNVEVLNLFRYPFHGKRFTDNTYDVIWLSHIIEHIPHEIRPAPFGVSPAIDKMIQSDGDGWFAFFYECWRMLRPNGRMHVIAPFGFSTGGITDPTHTRYIMPGSFSYFSKNADAPFDYDVPFEFRSALDAVGQDMSRLKMTHEAAELTDVVSRLEAQIAVQPDNTYELIAQRDESKRYLNLLLNNHVNYCEEMYYSFEAVK